MRCINNCFIIDTESELNLIMRCLEMNNPGHLLRNISVSLSALLNVSLVCINHSLTSALCRCMQGREHAFSGISGTDNLFTLQRVI